MLLSIITHTLMEKLIVILKITVVVLVCIVLSLILIVLVKQQPKMPQNISRFETTATSNDSKAFKKTKVLFGDIGTLRAKTKDNVLIVIAPYFEYDENDTAFQEELVKNKIVMRELIIQFFKQKTKREIQSLGEENIKTEILFSINKILVLEKIEKLYFEKFIILE